MAGSAAEFERALRQAFGAALSAQADGLLLACDGVQLFFGLRAEQPTTIGALQLSALRVEIDVRSGDEAAARLLLARVDRATLRGGG